MNWADYSQLTLGLILDHRLPVNAVRPEIFIEPYDKCIRLLQKNPDMEIEELMLKTSFSELRGAFEAAHEMNGLGERDWVRMLEQSALLYDTGAKMQKISQRMMQGEDVKLDQLKGLLVEIEQDNVKDFKRMTEIRDEHMPFVPSGWKAFDDHMIGFPEAGMVILGGLPGSGKTTCVARILGSFVHEHKDKNVLLFSLEMMATEVVPRIRNVMKNGLTPLSESEMNRIIVCDKPLNVSEIVGRACKIEDLGLV